MYNTKKIRKTISKKIDLNKIDGTLLIFCDVMPSEQGTSTKNENILYVSSVIKIELSHL